MAATNTTLMSALYADDTQWLDANPDWTQVLNLVGPGSAANTAEALKSAMNMAQRSPITVAFVLAGDPDNIHVGHTLSAFNNDPLNGCPYDDHIILLVGDDLASAAPVLLPNTSFSRPTGFAAYNTAYMTGANGHGAAPAVYRFGHQAVGTADTDELRTRRALVLPCEDSSDFLSRVPTGIYTVQHFYNQFLAPHLGGNADIRAKWSPVEEWWRCACMNVNGGTDSKIAITPTVSGLPAATQALQICISKIRERELARVGVGGPQLSNAAFNTGVTQLQQTLNNNAQQRLQFERDRSNKTFTDKFGEHLANLMYKMTGAADDNGLPEVHKVLARAPKGQYYGILSSYVQARAIESLLPVYNGCLPVLTTKLVDQCFRSFQVCGIGNSFGEGLSPFSICCEGHPEFAKVVKRTRQAEIASAGNTTSLADADALTCVDTRYPTAPHMAAEKLYGWSILVDVFHGPDTAIAKNVRAMVLQIAPRMHAVHASAGANAVGMDYCNRILYDVTQTYMEWAEATALCQDMAALPAAPTFKDLISQVRTNRFYSLSPLPMSWYTLLDNPAPGAPSESRPRSAPSSLESTPRHQTGSVPVFNSHADRDMMVRFRNSGHQTIKAMMEGKNATIPKHQNKSVCLVWALKGECSSNCKRKDLHVRYPGSVNKAIHTFLDKCEVATLQG